MLMIHILKHLFLLALMLQSCYLLFRCQLLLFFKQEKNRVLNMIYAVLELSVCCFTILQVWPLVLLITVYI